jgi:hypothetical protein
MMNNLTDRVPNAIGAPTGGSRPVAGRDPQGATPAKDAWRVVSEARDSIGHGPRAPSKKARIFRCGAPSPARIDFIPGALLRAPEQRWPAGPAK